MIKQYFARIMCFLTIFILLKSFTYSVNSSQFSEYNGAVKSEKSFSEKSNKQTSLNTKNEEIEEVEEAESRCCDSSNSLLPFVYYPNSNTYTIEISELETKVSIFFNSQNRIYPSSEFWLEDVQILI